ncbi:DUF2958 domain-containing protein [Rhizobium mongolense]|uniref:DUF2958 family protein n=2 Tax=Rhizobium mongolense TaxID=57676 RepID=A0ABR6IQA5_9HYPH|nr:DUF2958 domain-containing protein [Rhizobium mongolense]MBB4230069.1 hypothetical protein [Rhizobium mongolense]TVZ72800.1 Protein of unknown function (DUF2958) [Rhizobium mongolense USDA 1844]
MLLVTMEQRAKLLENFANKDDDHIPVVKLFTPWANATWLFVDLDPEDEDRLFGLCDLGHGSPELGYALLSELEGLKGPWGLKIKRDLHFHATRPLSEYTIAARAARRIVEI